MTVQSSEDKQALSIITSAEKGQTCRLSYAKIFKPEQDQQGKMKYSTMLLIPKVAKDTVDKIKGAMAYAVKLKWGAKTPPNLKVCLRDGDKEGPGGLPDGTDAGSEPYVGHYFMNIKNDRKPGIVDQGMQPIEDETRVVSGDYARVSMNCFTWVNDKGGKGVSFGMNNIQLVKKGEPLGGGSSPDSDFEAIAPQDSDELATLATGDAQTDIFA